VRAGTDGAGRPATAERGGQPGRRGSGGGHRGGDPPSAAATWPTSTPPCRVRHRDRVPRLRVVYRYTVWVSSPPGATSAAAGRRSSPGGTSAGCPLPCPARSSPTWGSSASSGPARGHTGSPTSWSSGGGAGHADHLPAHLRLVHVRGRHRRRPRLHHVRHGGPHHQLRRPVARRLGRVPRAGRGRGAGTCRLRLVPVAALPPARGGHRAALRLRLPPAGEPGRDRGHRPADLVELAARRAQLRLPGRGAHGHGRADAGLHPFGKFFHVVQRPASVGVEVYRRAALERDGVFACRRCQQPVEGVTQRATAVACGRPSARAARPRVRTVASGTHAAATGRCIAIVGVAPERWLVR
jgi:hypothetical protein